MAQPRPYALLQPSPLVWQAAQPHIGGIPADQCNRCPFGGVIPAALLSPHHTLTAAASAHGAAGYYHSMAFLMLSPLVFLQAVPTVRGSKGFFARVTSPLAALIIAHADGMRASLRRTKDHLSSRQPRLFSLVDTAASDVPEQFRVLLEEASTLPDAMVCQRRWDVGQRTSCAGAPFPHPTSSLPPAWRWGASQHRMLRAHEQSEPPA